MSNTTTNSALEADLCMTDTKRFATLQAQFALHGHTLQALARADDGRVSYTVSRWGQSRSFTHWHDMEGFLAQIGGNHEL